MEMYTYISNLEYKDFKFNADRAIRLPGVLFLVGTILFSGSIYLLVLSPQRWLGPITPIGGLFLIAGWVSLAYVLTTVQAPITQAEAVPS